MTARSIVIVGNGEIGAGLSGLIDAADIVMRFNDCRSAGPGGTKTDIVTVCNTGRPGRKMVEEPGWKENPAVRAAGSIWCVRDPKKFEALRAPLGVSHPELDDFCDDYTSSFAAYADAAGKDFHIVPATTHEGLDRELAAYHPAPYVVPSTGIVAIAEFLAHFRGPGDRIGLAGFGHQGWEWHPWDAERQWVEARIAENSLHRLFQHAPIRSASGV
jgi:hypothetical protein